MGRRLLTWWEGLPGRRRVVFGIPIALVVLFGFHQAFPLLSWQERLMYAVMEAVPLALVLAWATENELRRRTEAQSQSPDDADAG